MELVRIGEHVTLEPLDSGIALLTLCHEASHNALGEPMVRALDAALTRAEAWPALKVVVLLGLPDVFSSGADPSLLGRLLEGSLAPAEILLPRRLFAVPVPIVAAMEGHAIGGGLALGLCADVIVAARESRYGVTFTDLGFTPGMGTTRLCEHAMLPALAHELLFTGEARRGAELDGRAFNAIVPRSEVRPRAIS
ncbi:MAG: enoyl-CoA hydratase/isomerase family protein, partial [Sandaracinaceae bacterium]|nr:enoyl-CoA hydratase/isomerase family protein [Sandaracinaceae bacterium]